MSLERAQQSAPEMGHLGPKEHRRLVHAIRRHDVEQAGKIMRQHLGRTAKHVKNL